MNELHVRNEALPYLHAQRGAISDIRGDGNQWLTAYVEMLESEFRSMESWLPKECDSILDVGGGMGGIDILLSRHYGGCHVTILDGVHDRPIMTKHAHTFAHFDVAKQFLNDNGIEDVGWIDANAQPPAAQRHFDLVVSLKSWCFHYPVEQYAKLAADATVEGSILMIDIRRAWVLETIQKLSDDFVHTGMSFYGVKFETHVFRRK